MNIQLVVFDMAGTTVQDDDAVNDSLRHALANNRVQVTRDEVNQVMGMPKPRAIRLLLEMKRPAGPAREAGETPAPPSVSNEEVEAIYALFLSQMVRYYQEDPRVREIPGATAVFRRLRARGIKTALDTGFSRPILDAIVHRLDWGHPELLDTTVASDEVKRGRPHPDLIFEAMRRTGVAQAGQVAKVGDTPADLLEGQAAGCQLNIGVTYGSHTRAQLASQPHTHLIGALDEVLGIVAG